MRIAPTPPEAAFRQRLLDAGIPFEFQAIVAPYIADFAFPSRMLIIELDGAHHKEPEKLRYDARRDAYLRRRGFTILRIDNCDAPNFSLETILNYGSVRLAVYTRSLKDAALRFTPETTPKKPKLTAQQSRGARRERKRATKARYRARLKPCPRCGRLLTPTNNGYVIKHNRQGRMCEGVGLRSM